LYTQCSRYIFSVEPSEEWLDLDEFKSTFLQFFNSIRCSRCQSLLLEPCVPKKNHLSCNHRVCLECVGRKKASNINCKLCNDFALYEKNQPVKVLMRCFQDLCELVKDSWIYEYMQRHTNHDTGQEEDEPNLFEIIESGINYGKSETPPAIIIDETSSEESSSSSVIIKDEPIAVPCAVPQTFSSNLSSLAPASSNAGLHSVQSQLVTVAAAALAEPVVVQPPPPSYNLIQPPLPIAVTTSSPSIVAVSQIVQYHQPQLLAEPSTSKLIAATTTMATSIMKSTASFTYPSPMKIASSPITTKSIVVPPMKIATFSSAPQPNAQSTIYSVINTGSGNKLTLKRKPPEEILSPVQEMKTATTYNVSYTRLFIKSF